MKSYSVPLLIAAAILVLLIWKPFSKEKASQVSDESEISEQEEMASPIETGSTTGATDANTAAPTPSADAVPVQVSDAEIKGQFLESLKGLGACLDIKNTVDQDQSEPTLDNMVYSLRNEIGDPVIHSEDWSNTHITLPSGEQRRIRIEMDYEADDRIVKKLKYFGVDKENLPVPIPVDKDLATDPQESFISSLEKDGKVSMREKGERVYFQNGEEIVFVERNGRLLDIEMNKAGRTFKCTNLNAPKANCNCL